MKKIKLLTLMLGFSFFAYGQGQDTLATQDTINLIEVNVTGIRADSKTPVTQKTITGESIKPTYQGEEVSQVLDKTPSITSSTDGGHSQGYTYFRLRGIDQTRVNMTLNGVPLNEPEDQGVYFSNYPGFSNNIGSMQIQRGVGTSTNGVSSYAGSINFESPLGTEKQTNIDVGYGSFNTQRFNISNSTGLNKGFALYSNFSIYQSDGYKYNSGGQGYSFFLSGGYYGTKDIVKVTAFSGRSFNDMAWLPVSETDIKIDPRTNYNSVNAKDDFMQSFVQVQYTRSLSKRSFLTTTGYYNRLDGNWDLDLATFGAGPDILNFQLSSNFYGIMTNYKLTTDKLNLNIGLHGNAYARQHAMAARPDLATTFYTNTGFKNEFSSFVKAGYDIGKFTLFADAQLRYVTFDYEGFVPMESVNWLFFNPKGGVLFKTNDKHSMYLTVGQSHREPTRTDMFAGEDDLITFNEVTPEEVVDVELGTKYVNKKFNIDANLYFMSFKNEITLIGALGSNGLPLMTNVENSFRSGVEVDVAYRVHKMVTLTNNTTFSYNRIIDGGEEFEPLYSPAVISNTGVMFKYKGVFVGINSKYHSESYIDFDNDYVTPAFIVLNANLGFAYKNFSIMGQLNNLTNQEYYTNGYVIGTERYFFVNAPLSGNLTIKMKF